MEEQSVTVLESIGVEVLDWLRATADVVGEQAPLLAQDVVRYGIFDGVVSILVGLVLLAVTIFVLMKVLPDFWGRGRALDKNHEDGFGWYGVSACLAVCSVFGGITGFVWTVTGVFTCGKALLAPRLYILQEIAKLVG